MGRSIEIIRSKYFPSIEECITLSQSNEIEIPADIYDIAVCEGKITPKNFIRGNYDYETAKIFAQSDRVEALKFDPTSGEIKTSSTVGISAEITFALAMWNGYSRETAIERAILARMRNINLPADFKENFSHVNSVDAYTIEEDFAKSFAGKSVSYVNDRIQTAQTASVEVPVNIPHVQKFFHKASDFVAGVGDEFVMVFPYLETISDFAKGRISGKQALKNAALVAVGVAGAAAAVAIAPVGGFIATLFIGFGGKKFSREGYRPFFDAIYAGDNKKLLEIFDAELAEALRGKFLTGYEREILLEAIGDAITKNDLKDMYQYGNISAQKNWACKFIKQCLQNVAGSRLLVIMPTADEWQAGLQRVKEMITGGEDINARMEQQRAETLSRRREILARYDLKPYEIAKVVSIINPMLKTQVEIGRTLTTMQHNESIYQLQRQQLMNEREVLKENLNRRR